MDLESAFADGRKAMGYLIRGSLVKNGLSDTFAVAMMVNQGDDEISEDDIKNLLIQEAIYVATKLRLKYTVRAVTKFLTEKVGFDPRDTDVIVAVANDQLGDKAYVHKPPTRTSKVPSKGTEVFS